MRLLLDANLSPRLTDLLTLAGFDVLHVAGVGLLSASDDEIVGFAYRNKLVVVTADSVFPMLLALRRTAARSVVHLRHVAELSPGAHATLLESGLGRVAVDLERGAVVSLSPTRLAVRDLPIR